MRRTRRKTSVIYAEQIQQALEACSIYPEHKAMLSRMYEELDKFLIGEFFVTPDTRRDIEGD